MCKRECVYACAFCAGVGGNDSMHASIYIRISFSKGNKERKKLLLFNGESFVRPYFPLSFAYVMRAFFKGALCVGLKIKWKYTHTHAHPIRSDRVRKTPTDRPTEHIAIHTMSSLFRCWYFFCYLSRMADHHSMAKPIRFCVLVCIFDQCKLQHKNIIQHFAFDRRKLSSISLFFHQWRFLLICFCIAVRFS